MTDVGYGISSKFRIDDSDLAKLERRLTGIGKSIAGIKRSLVDALYGAEVRSALDALERRVAGVAGKAARAARAGGAAAGPAAGTAMPAGPASGGGRVRTAAPTASPSDIPPGIRGLLPFYDDWSYTPRGGRPDRILVGGGGRVGTPRPPPPRVPPPDLSAWDGGYDLVRAAPSGLARVGGGIARFGGPPPRGPTPRMIGGPVGDIPRIWPHPVNGHEVVGGPDTSRRSPLRLPDPSAYLGYGVAALGAAGVAGAYGAYGAAQQAIDVQREAESGRMGITAAMAAFGGVPIGPAEMRSADVYSQLERMAAVGPGETNDYAFAFQRIFGPLHQRGATDQQMMDLVAQSIAGGSMLWGSAGAKFGPMDIMQALTSGMTDRTTPLAAMAIQSAGYTQEQFRSAEGVRQIEMLIEGFGALQPAIALMAKTVDAQEHTFSDAMKRMVRTVTGPAYELYRHNLMSVNDSLSQSNAQRDKEIEAAKGLTTSLAYLTDHGVKGLVHGFQSGSDMMIGAADHLAISLSMAADTVYAGGSLIGSTLATLGSLSTYAASAHIRGASGAGSATDTATAIAGAMFLGGPIAAGMVGGAAALRAAFGPGHEEMGSSFNMEADAAEADRAQQIADSFILQGGGAADAAARAAAAARSGRNREIVVRIADFKVDITEPRAIARSYKRVVAEAVEQIARAGIGTATDGAVL